MVLLYVFNIESKTSIFTINSNNPSPPKEKLTYEKMQKIIYLWRSIKSEVVGAYVLYIALFRTLKFRGYFLSYKPVLSAITNYREAIKHLHTIKKAFIYKKCIVIKIRGLQGGPLTNFFNQLVGSAWFCEKMGVDFEYSVGKNNDATPNLYDGIDLKLYKKNNPKLRVIKVKFPEAYRNLAEYIVPPEFGHKALLKVRINPDIEKYVDRYINVYAEESWVAVHYRGTDVKAKYKHRYKVTLESYIAYLKGVLDSQCRIFTCSDQAQFIDEMHDAFPSRVFARDIQRSDDTSPIHKPGKRRYTITHQEKDALIDLLILARSKLVYTNGSGFVDLVRWLNPETKIISLDERKRKGNYMPIPKKDTINFYDRKQKR